MEKPTCEHCKRPIENGYQVEENGMGGYWWEFCSKLCLWYWSKPDDALVVRAYSSSEIRP